VLRAIGCVGPAASDVERSLASAVRLHEVKRVAEFVNRRVVGAAFDATPGRHAEAYEQFRRYERALVCLCNKYILDVSRGPPNKSTEFVNRRFVGAAFDASPARHAEAYEQFRSMSGP